MNYFPCNNIGISVDGEPHQGVLKLRNEYVPLINYDDILPPDNNNNTYVTNGAFAIEDDFYALGSSGDAIYNNGVKSAGQSNLYADNRIVYSGYGTNYLMQYKNIGYIDDDVYYVSYYDIYKVNVDRTITTVGRLPNGTNNRTLVAGFKNENNEKCLFVIGYAVYVYNIDTGIATTVSFSPPYSRYGCICESISPNIVYVWIYGTGTSSSEYWYLYKYNISTNTFTQVSVPSATISRMLTFNTILVNNKEYYVIVGKKEVYSGYNDNRTRDHLYICDDNWNVIHCEKLWEFKRLISVFPYNGYIGLMETIDSEQDTSNNSPKRPICHVYKFDVNTRRMYDMSIPHLVIDES